MSAADCGARDAAVRFRADVVASIRQIPPRFQEPLTSAANDLVDRLSSCTPPPPPADEEGAGHD
jgi:hypothetical protein